MKNLVDERTTQHLTVLLASSDRGMMPPARCNGFFACKSTCGRPFTLLVVFGPAGRKLIVESVARCRRSFEY
jgi:hypothetical protein